MPFGCRQVDEPAIGEHEQPLPGQPPLFDELANRLRSLTDLLQAFEIDFYVEMSRVRENRAVFHNPHVLDPYDLDIARQGDEQIADWCRSEEHTSELQSRRDLVCRL